MKMRLRNLCVFLFFISPCLGQTIISDDSVIMKKGIYRNFYEFKNNCPSIELKYEILTNEIKPEFWTNITHNNFSLKISKLEADSIGNIFGFCDGTSVYIIPPPIDGEGRNKFSHKTIFEKLSYIGFYCLFKSIIQKANPGFTNSSGMTTGGSSQPILTFCYFNINSYPKELMILKKNTLKEILLTDEELFDQYKNEPNKNEVLDIYLIKFSEKHKNEINKSKDELLMHEILDYIKFDSFDSTNIDNYLSKVNLLMQHVKGDKQILINKNYNKFGKLSSIGLAIKYEVGNTYTHPMRILKWYILNTDGSIKQEVMYDFYGNASEIINKN